jgi:hypothetical protein
MTVRITISRSLNGGRGLGRGRKRSSIGGDNISTKLYGY